MTLGENTIASVVNRHTGKEPFSAVDAKEESACAAKTRDGQTGMTEGT